MRSDWEDAPAYLRRRKQPGPWRWVVILGIGSVIFWALVALFGKPLVVDIAAIRSGVQAVGAPWYSQKPAQPAAQPLASYDATAQPQPAPQQRSLSQDEIDWFNTASARAVQSRQTSFNDDNYTPKQPASTYAPPATQRGAVAPAISQRQSRAQDREHTAKWIKSWNGGTNYLAEWNVVDNHIDGSSVCGNHRRGSIDYRECRKAAKQHFHEQCRVWRARFDGDRADHSDRMRVRYCGASSTFNPMG